mmetsp:Transcript_3841/g.9142  ORF Transcript_3841/g.9142 Transcript_3841/m.9142 type:complete len:209 (-) Transcript_3841:1255-1881(-)
MELGAVPLRCPLLCALSRREPGRRARRHLLASLGLRPGFRGWTGANSAVGCLGLPQRHARRPSRRPAVSRLTDGDLGCLWRGRLRCPGFRRPLPHSCPLLREASCVDLGFPDLGWLYRCRRAGRSLRPEVPRGRASGAREAGSRRRRQHSEHHGHRHRRPLQLLLFRRMRGLGWLRAAEPDAAHCPASRRLHFTRLRCSLVIAGRVPA